MGVKICLFFFCPLFSLTQCQVQRENQISVEGFIVIYYKPPQVVYYIEDE